jgi:hypothetical protein
MSNHVQVFQQYVQYVRDKQAGVSQAEEDLVAGLQVGLHMVLCS